jgi:hypothetical protein
LVLAARMASPREVPAAIDDQAAVVRQSHRIGPAASHGRPDRTRVGTLDGQWSAARAASASWPSTVSIDPIPL